MTSTINMQDMRYLNLFGKVTRVDTRFCFFYNDTIYFCVPKPLLSRAVGQNGRNVKEISSILGKKIKVIPIPAGIQHAKPFIETIIFPVTFKNLEVTDKELIITAGNMQTKAALIGRNKVRLVEMQKIVHDFFGREFRII